MKHIFADGFRRINKTQARKMFNEGKPVYCAPCNRNPVSPYGTIFRLDYAQPIEPEQEHSPLTFDRVVSSYERLGCFNIKSGRYAAFYIQAEDYLGPSNGRPLVNTTNSKGEV